jgi:cell division protein FtsI (penicillin-binding protein 3)
MSFGRVHIHDAEKDHAPGIVPLEKVIKVSSNVGAAKVAAHLGAARVRATLDDFGLTSKTGISLPGEVASPPKPDRAWLPIFLATVGFGQGVSVTPLQMVTAYAPFANGGYRIHPRILLREGNAPDRLERHRVLSPETVTQMKQILLGVTEKGGTGYSARIPNVAVAGKTGTAQKYEAGAGYASRKFMSSFIGFLPADKPELLIGVFVDEPQGAHTGAQVAAPVFKRIAERSLQILDRAPKRLISSEDLAEPPIPMAPLDNSPERPLVNAAPKEPPMLQSTEEGFVLPDLKGLSMREALRLIGEKVENVKVSGSGYVESQEPKAGTVVRPGSRVALSFSPLG